MDIPYKVVYFRCEFASSKQWCSKQTLARKIQNMEKYIYCCGKQICMLEGKENPHDSAAT